MFRIAAFNVENMFDRAKAFNESDTEAQRTIKAVAELNAIFEEANYTQGRKNKILELVDRLDLNRFNEGPLALIRTIRGKVLKRPQSGGIEVVADGRDDWIGWAELKTAPVDEVAVENTGRVLRDVDADILAVVEAENRVVLQQFTELIFDRVVEELPAASRPSPYTNFMLIDGNDDRGIDVGLMTKEGFEVGLMRSHINDRTPEGQRIFSRDCPEYSVTTPDGEVIWVLPNHFKSKFGGNDARSIAKRTAQSVRTAEIYDELRAAGEDNVVVLGDLNDTPDSDPLQPLLAQTDLAEVTASPSFDPGEFNVPASNTNRGIGTFGLGNDNQKIDYLLLSPPLFARIRNAGLFRKGAWPGSRPQRWSVYDQLEEKIHVASDHHVIWADID
ncbi:MAG: endonuclease/exonuclease/phosphatase family protein [Myxococcota bacterium]|nr:endonuclease/exonuclease/phosphatase family protein [Myxococcota bacterium]